MPGSERIRLFCQNMTFARRAAALADIPAILGRETDTDCFELYVLRRAGDLLPFERQRQALLLGV